MTDITDTIEPTVAASLTERFLSNHPQVAAKRLEQLPDEDVAPLLGDLPATTLANVLKHLSPSLLNKVLQRLSPDRVTAVISEMDPGQAAILMSRVEVDLQEGVIARLDEPLAKELRNLLSYPSETAGRLMDTRVNVFPGSWTVTETIELLRRRPASGTHTVKVVDDERRLTGLIDYRDIILADPDAALATIARPPVAVASPMDPREDVVAKLEQFKLEELAVVDLEGQILGVIRHAELIDALKRDATVDIQTMVGASRDERALSTSWFAVRRRLPWLQVNLLTAFLAASVVGIFENTIAQFTALAVLLPVVAGQSGNAGAQALAVTMRGLALREIRVSHWFRVTRKEFNTGIWNGAAVALTCAVGVYVWSDSFGLVLVIAASMVISMVAAGIAGGLVPITLSRLGQDPAVASSIVLTTVTDIVGFFSFLGIATLLSGMLA